MDDYRVSIHTFGYYKFSFTDAELEAIEKTGRNNNFVYQLCEDHFSEADFGKLEDIEMGEIQFFPYEGEVTIKIKGYFCLYVEAENCSEAEEKADNAWNEADFGELKDVEYDTTVIRRSF